MDIGDFDGLLGISHTFMINLQSPFQKGNNNQKFPPTSCLVREP